MTNTLDTPPVKSRGRASYARRKAQDSFAVRSSETALFDHAVPSFQRRRITVIRSRQLMSDAAGEHGVGAPPVLAAKHVHRKLALLVYESRRDQAATMVTIRSAIKGGQNKRDIFVVDSTGHKAGHKALSKLIGVKHILDTPRSGEAMATHLAVQEFDITRNYRWLYIATAGNTVCLDYFRIYRKRLHGQKYAVAAGFVQSSRQNLISTYRAFSGGLSRPSGRRYTHTVAFPGSIACFRTDILEQLEFGTATASEDFDLSLQLHRKHLGKVLLISRAIMYSDEPQTLRSFCRQTKRWQRSFFRGIKKHHIGLHAQRIDVRLGYQVVQTATLLVMLGVVLPLLVSRMHYWTIVPAGLAADFAINALFMGRAAFQVRRPWLIMALPYFYFLRWVELTLYLWAFMEIMIFNRFQSELKGWAAEGQRYKLDLTSTRRT